MLIKQGVGLRLLNSIKNGYVAFFVLLFMSSNSLYGVTFHLNIADLTASLIEIPTSNVSETSSTIASNYLVGEAPLYNANNRKVGTYSASFLSMQSAHGINTYISSYLSTEQATLIKNKLIVSWFTPTAPINLELDSIINSLVTQYTIEVTTKIGLPPSLGEKFDLLISSDSEKIYFQFSSKQRHPKMDRKIARRKTSS